MSIPPPVVEESANIQECWAAVEGGRMRYLCGGSGPSLLLIHGLLGYSFSWRFNLPAFSKQYTVYAPDLLGTGFSQKPGSLECCLSASADRLLGFLNGLGISSCNVIGTSHGGAVAMMLAAEAAQQGNPLRRLVLVAPANPWSPPRPLVMRILRSVSGCSLVRHTAPHAQFTHKFILRRMYGNPRRIPGDSLPGYSAPFAVRGSFEYGLSVVRSWRKDMRGLIEALPAIADLPTLLLWGTRDRAVSPKSASLLRQQFRQCELVLLDGAGHLPYEEMPEEFNSLVLDFLSRH
jgi:pimeloyl-ACP methyl ester carboxylesterase